MEVFITLPTSTYDKDRIKTAEKNGDKFFPVKVSGNFVRHLLEELLIRCLLLDLAEICLLSSIQFCV